MLIGNEKFLDDISRVVLEAGKITQRYFRSDPTTWEKSAENPVTVADLEADQFLHERLGAIDPGAAWLSEESHDRFEERKDAPRLWIVDPLDATKEFIEGVPDYSIIVAYVVAGVPEYAVVFNPARKQLFTAMRASGAWLNGRRIRASRKTSLSQARILVSRTDLRKGRWDDHPEFSFFGVGGSGYKLCLVATGMAEASINLSGLFEWDVAGSSLIVQEAGGAALDLNEQPFTFNTPTAKVGGQISAGTSVLLKRLHASLL